MKPRKRYSMLTRLGLLSKSARIARERLRSGFTVGTPFLIHGRSFAVDRNEILGVCAVEKDTNRKEFYSWDEVKLYAQKGKP